MCLFLADTVKLLRAYVARVLTRAYRAR